MKRLPARVGAYTAASAFCLAAALRLSAQTAPAAKPEVNEEPVVLSPFVVEASEDADSYAAKSTLAGTRVRTDLKDQGSAISVVTQQFLRDTGATSNATLLQYTTNTEVGGVGGNFSGVSAASGQYNENGVLLRPNTNTRVRGLDSADNTRDYFLSDIPWDSYNVGRVDLQRGPNSILFGVGSPAGIINTSINTASFKTAYEFENRVDKYGSLRNSIDLNQVILKDTLAIRVSALDDRKKFEQEPAYEDVSRIFAAVRYEPKLIKDGHTSIRANYEYGNIEANRPRTIPPVDAITPWFYTGTDPWGVQALNKRTQNPATDDRSLAVYGNYPWYGGSSVGRQFWQSTVAYYDNAGVGQPSRYISPMISTKNGIGPTGAVDQSIGGLQFRRPFAINNFDDYANKAGIPGGAYYSDKSLADPSIFNFYELLIDGDNKHEWQNWDAANFVVSQTFLNDRVGFEVAYDMQRYDDGQIGFLGSGGDFALSIDINRNYADGSPNPNVGRPYVASSTEGGNRGTDIDRDQLRATLYGELRFEDFMDPKSKLTQFLGRHVFTGLYSDDGKKTFERRWAQSAATAVYPTLIGESPSIANHVVAYDWQVYLGPSLASAANASNAHIGRINTIIAAPKQADLTFFDNRWMATGIPGQKAFVDPSAPYTYTDSSGNVINSTQSENPDNYGGFRKTIVEFRSADRGDIDSLYTASSKEKTTIKSQALTWQGYFMDGLLVPTVGWRKDEVKLLQGEAVANATTGTVNLNYEYDPLRNREAEGESRSWGAVLHMPKSWAEKLPGETSFSVFYYDSENFKADAPRQDVFGQVIANPVGQTKEYGFTISTLKDKLSLKVNWYETTVQNATISGDTGFNYLHWAVPAWGIAHAAGAQAGLAGLNNANSWLWNYAGNAGVPGGPGDPAWDSAPQTVLLKNALAAWKNIPLTQEFFNSYGNELAQIDVAKVKAGDYMGAWPKWAQGRADPQPGSATNRVAAGDTTSEGIEFELVAQPVKNWNITANVSKVNAMRTAVSPTIANYMNQMTSFLAGPAGDLRIWGGGDPFRKVWADEAISRYNVLLTQIGSSAPEVPEWRFNVVTTYAFDHGALNGAFIGGGYRWEDERILTYQFDSKLNGLDVNKPLMGPTDDHFDLWVGYSRKLGHKLKWRIQLNMRNLGEDTHLVPITLQPDGSPAMSRIQEGMSWMITNNFQF